MREGLAPSRGALDQLGAALDEHIDEAVRLPLPQYVLARRVARSPRATARTVDLVRRQAAQQRRGQQDLSVRPDRVWGISVHYDVVRWHHWNASSSDAATLIILQSYARVAYGADSEPVKQPWRGELREPGVAAARRPVARMPVPNNEQILVKAG